MSIEDIPHWSSDPYWNKALEAYYKLRDSGVKTLSLDIEQIEAQLFDGDSPAYRLVSAMQSVIEHEGSNGHRGAPRLVLALLTVLSGHTAQA